MNTKLQSTQNQPIYDVIISGAGPVGLFLACELSLANCSVLILEKAADTNSALKKLPFGIRGLSAPSVAAFYRRGLLQEFELHKHVKNPHAVVGKVTQQAPAPIKQVGHFAGIPIDDSKIDTSQWKYRLPGATATHLLSEMAEIETVLRRRAVSLGAEIRFEHAIDGFDQTIDGFDQSADGVTVLSAGTSFRGKWLVGCDGSRSMVRKTGGFEFAGTEPEFTGYNAQVEIADPEKLSAGRNVTERGMYLQSQPGYLIIQDFDGGAFHHLKEEVTAAHLQEVLRRISATDVTINKVHIASTWTDRSRQATAYRKGRVLLAGDAAHIHSPLGGQGLNLGLGDALNLGWKLAATIHNRAPEGLLDSYHTERAPVAAQVLDWSRAQVTIMKPNPHAAALYAIMRDLINTSDGATYIAGRIWGVSMHYNLGSSHPLAGYSVPDFSFSDGRSIGDLMHDGKGILLDFVGDQSVRAIAEEYDPQVKYISRPVKDQLGLSALLIRPDGIVAWAADHPIAYSELQTAAAIWFKKRTNE